MTHVLVVEDEPAIWQNYNRILRTWGHSCCWASDFEGTRKLVAQMVLGVEPMASAALVDLGLHGSIGTGVDVLNLLPTCVQPIVISGHSVEEVRRRITYPYARVNVYISKPPTAEDWENLYVALANADGGRVGR